MDVNEDRRPRSEQRSVVRTSVRRAVAWGLFWGLLKALNSTSWGDGSFQFVRVFLLYGSLVLVGTPRKLATERANDATADLAGVTAAADRAKVVRTAKRVIADGGEVKDPEMRAPVLARADILRRTPKFDRAALWIPLLWIATWIVIAGYRAESGQVAKSFKTWLVLLVLAWWLFRRQQFHRTMRLALQTYSRLLTQLGDVIEVPNVAGPRYKLSFKSGSAGMARPVWLVFGEHTVHVLGRHFTPSNITIAYDDVACAQEIRQKWFGATSQRQIRLLGDADSEWLLITRRPRGVLAVLRANGVPVHAGVLEVSARELSRRRAKLLDIAPHDVCRALRFGPNVPGRIFDA